MAADDARGDRGGRGPGGEARFGRGDVRDARGPERRDVGAGPETHDRGRFGEYAGPRPADVRVRYADGGRYYAGVPAIIDGCPPGLAKKNNGCLPPGQARRIWGNPDSWSNWYGDWDAYRRDPRYDYRYADGYLYQVDPGSNLISAFLPLLGGALFGGNIWPTNYTNYDVPDYYGSYYGWDDGLDYRYADGAIFGVDRSSGRIEDIAALLAGDSWTVGQRMPVGYDFYNVPPEFRERYVDGPDDWYRYSDGYVYQVDPKTQLVRAAFELLSNRV